MYWISLSYLQCLTPGLTKAACSTVMWKMGNVLAVCLVGVQSGLGNNVPDEHPVEEKCRRFSLTGYQMHSTVEKNICFDERNDEWKTN